MSNNNFKTAAAKLLAQHSADKKKDKPAPAPEPVKYVETAPPVAAQRRVGGSVGSAGTELASLIRGGAIPFLALLGCVIMVFAVPETIFGMWFNFAFGLVSGAVFGVIIVRELTPRR